MEPPKIIINNNNNGTKDFFSNTEKIKLRSIINKLPKFYKDVSIKLLNDKQYFKFISFILNKLVLINEVNDRFHYERLQDSLEYLIKHQGISNTQLIKKLNLKGE